MKILPFCALAVAVAGCASQPNDIQTSYVSEVQYQNYDCDQLRLEAGRISTRAAELHSQLKETADRDAAQMGLGLVLFWPALFFLEGGDGAQASEYARLKGEREAIEKASVQKKCSINFQPTPVTTTSSTTKP